MEHARHRRRRMARPVSAIARPGQRGALSAVAFGTELPAALRGAPSATVLQSLGTFSLGDGALGMLRALATLYATRAQRARRRRARHGGRAAAARAAGECAAPDLRGRLPARRFRRGVASDGAADARRRRPRGGDDRPRRVGLALHAAAAARSDHGSSGARPRGIPPRPRRRTWRGRRSS